MGKGRKVALLVGVGTYGAGLKSLQCPANGVAVLQAVLETPEIGGFDEVIPLVDPDVGTMRTRLVEVFSSLKKEDLVLFYFTGHGIKDTMGDFYLTTSQTHLFANRELNRGTAIEASFVKGEIQRCYAQRKVVVLDCCFGAAFADGFLTMDDGGVDVQANLGGEGWVVLTAATARNYALEQEGEPLSVYTRYLVEGLKTGAAAPEGQTHITVGQLHAYVQGKVKIAAPTMEPAIFNALAGQEISLAKAVINPELIYRQKVQSKIRRGRIAPAGRRFLETWQTRLNLGAERAGAIEAEVLKPFAEKQRHLDLYAETLREEIEEEFPLCPEAIQDLKELQKLWSLPDEDVDLVVREVLQAQGLEGAGGWGEMAAPTPQRPPQVPDTYRQEQIASPSSKGKQAAPPEEEDELRSEKGVDYTRLRDLLKAGQWKEADQETAHRMLQAVGRKSDDWIRAEELKNFPCEDLRTIDGLWVKYSQGKFGFSVQKRIWQECGSPTSGGKDWDKFCVRVGWQDKTASRYLGYDDLKADPSISPSGEFPSECFWKVPVSRRSDLVSSLASRLVNCSR